MTNEKSKSSPGVPHPADAPLQGQETLDLYLSEIGRNMLALGAQSALLLSAWKEQVALLHGIAPARSAPVAPAAQGQEPQPENVAGDVPGTPAKPAT